MTLISAFMMVVLTTMTGTIVFGMWKAVSAVLEKSGKIRVIKGMLNVTICFYLVPVVFLYLAFRTGLFGNTKTGILFRSTPVFVNGMQAGALVWSGGFLAEVIRYLRGQVKIRKVVRRSFASGARIRQTAETIRAELQIRRNIEVCVCPGLEMPMIAGFIRCVILLPEKTYTESALRMILKHELLHYRHGDLILKKLCAWILRIQWFNPFVRILSSELDIWGDAMCDLRICYGDGASWGIGEYFSVVIDNSRKENGGFGNTMRLKSSADKLERRIKRMKKYRKQNEMKRWAALLLMICFTLASSLTSLAAGRGVELLYNRAYAATKVMETSNVPGEDDGLVEFTRPLDPDQVVVDTGAEVNLNARGYNIYEWTIPGGELYETGIFYASKGDTVAITVSPVPKGAATTAGLHEPSGVLWGVNGYGTYAYTFTVRQSGFHRAFVENRQATAVSVAFVVNR